MRLCAAQTRPIKGDIPANMAQHKQMIDLAVSEGIKLIIFPELSLTGYEPTLAKVLAVDQDDGRLNEFQAISDAHQMTIGVGVPTKHEEGICISMIFFQAHRERRVYSKTYLHSDEDPFFVGGRNSLHLQVNQTSIALAICYDISVSEHLESALTFGPDIYVASVAKFASGIDKALERLAGIARDSSMPVLMSNCVGLCDGSPCAGKSSIWDHEGSLIGQLNHADEGILIFDTDTHEVVERVI